MPCDGGVSFRPADNGLGTVVTLRVRFDPPLGPLGDAAVWLLGPFPTALAGRAVRFFKALAETGEVPTTAGQPAARSDPR